LRVQGSRCRAQVVTLKAYGPESGLRAWGIRVQAVRSTTSFKPEEPELDGIGTEAKVDEI
jgi:hypothetical protein